MVQNYVTERVYALSNLLDEFTLDKPGATALFSSIAILQLAYKLVHFSCFLIND